MYDTGPTPYQHRVKISFLLGRVDLDFYKWNDLAHWFVNRIIIVIM